MDARKDLPAGTPAPAEPPREVELKLALDPEAIDGVLAHPLLAKARPAPARGGALQATYFDTEGQDLREAGLSLRIRREGARWIQTLKADGTAPGLVLDRAEWETPVDGEALDWTALEGTALAPLMADGRLQERLRPVFSVHTERRTFLLDRRRARLEVVLDIAELRADGRTERFGEIELELKRGTAEALFAVARDLAKAAPARLSLATKSARGYALADGRAPEAAKAEKVRLSRGLTSAEAFQAVARSCLAQALRNEPLVRERRLAEAVHQFRVGLRRLRAAASLFGDLVSDEESRSVRAELRWMNHATAAARDLDVLIARLEAAPDHADALAAARRRREEAYDELVARLDEPRFRCAMIAAAAWIETGRWLALEDADLQARRSEPIEDRAARELAKRWKRVGKRAKRLEELDAEARHDVRIEIKKLRYGVEFLGGLFPGGKAKKRRKQALAALQDLQEILGELNDIAVGGDLLGPPPAVERPHDPQAPQPEVDDLLARAGQVRRALAATKPFWK